MQRNTTFQRERTIRFHHCDPAGIVFYPQYLVMLHAFIERWFDEGLGYPYRTFMGEQRLGIPVVQLECQFFVPSRMGDKTRFSLAVARMGSSSIDLVLEVHGVNEHGVEEMRMKATQTVVVMSLDTYRAVAISAPLRERLSEYLQAPSGSVPEPDDERLEEVA
ncbi:acyl-CoA thioesterase [Paraburkholderia sp. EG287B]|uniref:acyl-CoA thioesterase n=1 Tax=Paraburkholderia sp. EG287B TaxID=3237010 RepID=UPI0034D17FD5